MKTLFHIFRIILSVVFIISGLSKIISPQTFAEAINSLFNFPVYWSVCSRGCENTFPENPTNCYNWCVDAMTRMGCY